MSIHMKSSTVSLFKCKIARSKSVGKYFAFTLIALDIGASISYGTAGNWRMCVYWMAAAVLTLVVTI